VNPVDEDGHGHVSPVRGMPRQARCQGDGRGCGKGEKNGPLALQCGRPPESPDESHEPNKTEPDEPDDAKVGL